MTPVLSCVCPTHGRAHVLGEAVESYLRQAPPGVPSELVLVCDCPEQPIACAATGVRVVNLPEPIPDASRKFNAAAAESRGEWIVWWEDDDISLPSRLVRSWELIQQTAALYVKQSHAFCWNHGKVTHWQGASLFFGSAIFSRDYYHACGGATPGDWADGSAHANMLKGGCGHIDQCTPADTFFIYRWAGLGPLHHDSALHDKTAAERFTGFRRGTLSDPRFQPGLQTIVPGWQQDYPALCEQWRQENPAWTR